MIFQRALFRLIKTAAVPLLLSAVALRQILLVQTAGLSPWHGGGFGMFASVDRDERRLLMTTVSDCDGMQWPLDLATMPELLSPHAYTHVATFPTTAQLQAVARRVISQISEVSVPVQGATLTHCVGQVQLQVWRLTYDGEAIVYEPITQPVEVQP